jgi:hypothetical protein
MFCKALVSAHIAFGSPKKTRNEENVGLKVRGLVNCLSNVLVCGQPILFVLLLHISFAYGIQKGIVACI